MEGCLTKVANLVHGAFLHVVELLGRGAASEDGEGPFIGSAADAAVDVGFYAEGEISICSSSQDDVDGGSFSNGASCFQEYNVESRDKIDRDSLNCTYVRR